jgi:hypothetical protein
MKAILYAGAALMAGASIYGFIDYKKSSHDKAFTNLYKSHEPIVVSDVKEPVTEIKTVSVPEKSEAKKATTVAVKKTTVTPVVKKEGESKPSGKMNINPIETVKTETVKATISSVKSSSVKKKKKVLNHKLFSRGALDDRYIEKSLKLDEVIKTKQ